MFADGLFPDSDISSFLL